MKVPFMEHSPAETTLSSSLGVLVATLMRWIWAFVQNWFMIPENIALWGSSFIWTVAIKISCLGWVQGFWYHPTVVKTRVQVWDWQLPSVAASAYPFASCWVFSLGLVIAYYLISIFHAVLQFQVLFVCRVG